MKIISNIRDYNVFLESNFDFIDELANKENALYVIDKNVYEMYSELCSAFDQNRTIVIEATEQNKVIETALSICEKLTEIPAKRNAYLISIGGGIIQDITGFVANITYRGIHWIFVPTTLLSACDSCIGGKTSLNYKKYKNLLGTFFPPEEIHIASGFFRTLSERDFKSGLGEVVKFNIMAGSEGLNNIENNIDRLLNREPDVVNDFVETSLTFKKKFIEIDEFDRGERIKLNFAHTFGHAIEVISEYVIPHGTAVAIGMIMANSISKRRYLLSDEIAARSEQVLLKVIDIDINHLEKPIDDYLSAMRKDKKQTDSSLTAVLMEQEDHTTKLEVVHDITVEEVSYAIMYFKQLYSES